METTQPTRRKMVVYIRREYIVEERGEKAPYLHDVKKKGKDIEIDEWVFALLCVGDDRKISFLYDQYASKEMIKAVSNNPLFLEVCDFEFFNCYNEKIVDGWSGNFLDVLFWVSKNLFEIQREAGDCA
ncbi:hypothetical protein FACS1894103_1610 [Campylobacterota bacterium]|nr:hypothetical protein FACS1894103_1610 [Campylobacterota bacterium]